MQKMYAIVIVQALISNTDNAQLTYKLYLSLQR